MSILKVKVDNQWVGIPAITGEHVFIKYAAVQPTQNSDMKTTPDEWIGIYNGNLISPPSSYTSYSWYKIKGDAAPSEEVADAVSDWLDEHPEATTTVEDGSITNAKLHSNIQNQIEITETTKKDFGVDVENPESILVSGNADAFIKVHLANKKNFLPQWKEQTRTGKGVTVNFKGRFAKLSGEATGSGTIYTSPSWVDCAIPAGSYKLYVYRTGSYTTNGSVYFNLLGKTSGGTESTIRATYLSTTSFSYVYNVTVSADIAQVLLNFIYPSDLVITGTYYYWWGLYPDGVTVTDTDTTVADGETASFIINSTNYPNYIDSMQHEGSVTHHPTIQHYIDNKQINIDEELTYTTPEAFGAKGDNGADDTVAINNCIAYAYANNIAVRGYGQYKTTQPIVINGDNYDVFFKYINYTGNDYAVKFQGRYSTLQFDIIESNGTGIYVAAETQVVAYNTITVNVISAAKHGVHIYAYRNNYTNKLFFNYIAGGAEYIGIYADHDDNSDTGYLNEWYFHGGLLTRALWGIKGLLGSDSHISVQTEGLGSDGLGGAIWSTYANLPAIDYIRTGEIVNHNTVLKLSGVVKKSMAPPNTAKIGMTFDSIDISELTMPESGLNSDNFLSVTNFVIQKQSESAIRLTEHFTLWGNRIQLPPCKNIDYIVSADLDMSNYLTYKDVIPTKFITGSSSCRVDLHPTYASNCLNSFEIEQRDGHCLDIYDFLGNLIFDGSEYGNGHFKLTAYVNTSDPLKWDCSNQVWKVEHVISEYDLNTKAPSIIVETNNAYEHDTVEKAMSAEFYGNAMAFSNCMIANRKNYAPRKKINEYTVYTCTVSGDEGFIVINGTSNNTGNTSSIDQAVTIPAGNYKAILHVKPNETVLPSSKAFQFTFKYIDDTLETINITLGLEDTTANFFLSKDVKNIYVKPGLRNNAVYDNYTIWYGIFPSDATITDTGVTVANGSTFNHIIECVSGNFDTLEHKSVLSYVADTKTYIDNNMVTESELAYLSPEMYGAKGDMSVNDYGALQNCINDAILQGKAVRAYGNYKIGSTLVIDGSNLNIFIKQLYNTGSGAAVQVSGSLNSITIDYIRGYSSGCVGIEVVNSESDSATERNILSGTAIYAQGNAIKLTSSAEKQILYTTIRYKELSSQNDSVIYTTTGSGVGLVEEVSVHGVRFDAPNGWCFDGNSVKLYDCGMESNCRYGVQAVSAQIIGCRAREMMDRLMTDSPYYDGVSGTLFKQRAGSSTAPGMRIEISDWVYYDAIDLTDAVVPNDGTGSNASIKNSQIGVVRCPIVYGSLSYKYGKYVLGKEMIIHGKDRICVPQFKNVITIDSSTYDMRDETYASNFVVSRPPFATKFIVNASNCVIYLSPSYCAEGYSEFIVDMTNYMATIYDRRGNVMFDPTEHGYTNGIYKFSAIVDDTIDNVYQATHETGHYTYPINSGYCDVWEVVKIS